MGNTRSLAIALGLGLGPFVAACGDSPSGGLGIGFAAPAPAARQEAGGPRTLAEPRRQGPEQRALRLGRVYLPADAASAYVEVINDTASAFDGGASAWHLHSHAGQVSLPDAGPWAPGEARAVRGEALAPLDLHAQAGELLLLQDGLTPADYGAWGVPAGQWPSGHARLARRAGIDCGSAAPLPLAMDEGLAVDLAVRGAGAARCRPATGERSAADGPCEAAEPVPRFVFDAQEDDSGGWRVAGQRSDGRPMDWFGLRLCGPRSCDLLLPRGTQSRAGELPARARVRDRAGRSAGSGTPRTGASSAGPHRWWLLAPGDLPDAADARILAEFEQEAGRQLH